MRESVTVSIGCVPRTGCFGPSWITQAFHWTDCHYIIRDSIRAQRQESRIRNRENVSNRLKAKVKKGDVITFRLGVQRYEGIVKNRKGSHVVVDYLDTFTRTRKIANIPYYNLIEIL